MTKVLDRSTFDQIPFDKHLKIQQSSLKSFKSKVSKELRSNLMQFNPLPLSPTFRDIDGGQKDVLLMRTNIKREEEKYQSTSGC